MGRYRFTRQAEDQLREIARHTDKIWGTSVRRRYLADLKARLSLLCDNPGMGAGADHLYRGLRRFPHKEHVIYYTLDGADLNIVAILHHAMDQQVFFSPRDT